MLKPTLKKNRGILKQKLIKVVSRLRTDAKSLLPFMLRHAQHERKQALSVGYETAFGHILRLSKTKVFSKNLTMCVKFVGWSSKDELTIPGSQIKPFVLSLSKHERLNLRGWSSSGPGVAPSPLALATRALLASGMAFNAQAELPVPTAPVHLSTVPVDIATQGQAAAAVAGNAMTINQSTDKARIDWQSFNIGANNSVHFEQPSPSSVALNDIHQADASQILGSLSANGQVYLVNQNGFVFGPNSQINVNSLVATTLGISETVFQNGLAQAFTNNGEAALQGNGDLFLKDPQGNPVLDQHGEKIKIQILIEKGADIKTNAPNGRVIIAAPVINNAGTINTPDGQTILAAAKDKVYLQEAGANSDIRGLLVEVGTGGEVNNVGKVMAERGNVSLMGFAVNQTGMASATTSVNLNGSVRLLAREGIQDPASSGGKLLPKATTRLTALDDGLGTKAVVHLGSGSTTSVELDRDKAATALDAQAQTRSKIDIAAHDVYLHDQAKVKAKSGDIAITAIDNPADSAEKGDARIFLESGSEVDASGVKNVKVGVDKNIVKVELRKNELRDSPLQRDGVLFGKTVAVDVRKATLKYNDDGTVASAAVPVADIKGAVDRIARNIDERSTAGGSVKLSSSGDVVSQSESKIDVSGGSLDYQDGYVDSTQLQAGGRIFDISEADPNLHYDAVVAGNYFEKGYTEGKAAGELAITSYGASLNGKLDGSTVAGLYQRSSDERATGGSLSLDLSNNNLLGKQDIVFAADAQAPDLDFNEALPQQSDGSTAPLLLADRLFQDSGISHVNIITNGKISLSPAAKLNLPVDSSLNLAATGFDIQGSITAPSGDISLKPTQVNEVFLPSAINLGESANLDASGLWVNDRLDGQNLKAIASDGGSITLQAEQGDLNIAEGSRIAANGGAWFDNQAQVHEGHGGDINLAAITHDSGGIASNLNLQGEVSAWGLAQGGSLSLDSSAVVIGANNNAVDPAIKPLALAADFFRQGGVADFTVTASVKGLTVTDNTKLFPQQQNLQLNSGFANQASGSPLQDFTAIVTLPDEIREPANLSLNFSERVSQDRSQSLVIGEGASINTDIGGSVELTSDTSVWVNGNINTPGGKIAININTPSSGDKGFYAGQGIWLGENSHLWARGAFKPSLNPYGLNTGEVLSGGDISLNARRGYIVTRQGSGINVSGTAETLDFLEVQGNKEAVVSKSIASAGGQITLRASEGILADGALRGQKGGQGAADGTLNVELNRNLRVKPLLPIAGGLFPDDESADLPRSLVINAASRIVMPKTLAQGGDITTERYNGKALFTNTQLNKGGFGSLLFKTDALGATGTYQGLIQFNGDVTLKASQQIVLDTPTLKTNGGQVSLDAPYVALGSTQSRIDNDQGDGTFTSTLSPAAKSGTGQLSVNAKNLDLTGGLSFNGFKTINLQSQGDLRAVGIRLRSDTKDFLGELKLAGDLTIKASQFYPSTLTNYKVLANGKDASMNILGNGNKPAPVYSAGGALTIKADNISQAGVLKVPFGSLTLNAKNNLSLADGSLTSVSGEGLTVPLGQGSGGSQWLYPLDASGNTNIVVSSPPEKRLNLNGKTIALEGGASVDLSGGGDLYAYEFITGPGGSVDVLDANNAGFTEKYAVIPTLGKNALAPLDPLETSAAGLNVGESVYLGAGSALKAGWYTLLPAHYALLPGAYLVTPQAHSQDRQPGLVSTDLTGATIVTGRFGVGFADTHEPRWQGFAVEAGKIARTRSQYTDYAANTFFPAQALKDGTTAAGLPRDAGSLAIAAQTGLSLGAQLLAAPTAGGAGGQVDISADQLAIVGRRETLSATASDTVTLLADDLNQLNAPSLLLGGSRSKTSTGQRVNVAASTLTIAGDAILKGADILLAAQDEVRLQSGAVVASTEKAKAEGVALTLSNQGQNSSDGAFIRVSANAQADVVRTQKVSGKSGTLVVEDGAVLNASNALRLDSTKDTVFDGTLVMDGGSLALAASNISLGAAPKDTSGLVLASTEWNLDDLQLNSQAALDIYGPVALKAGQIGINAAQINGFNNAGDNASINADTVRLSNATAKAASAGDGTGTLAINANIIELGSGNYAINGFDQVNLNAVQTIKGLGQTLSETNGQSELAAAGNLSVNGDLNLKAGHFTGDAGATTSINANGHQVAINSNGAVDPKWTAGLGASWTINADAISGNGRFDLPSGILSLTAAQDDIQLNQGFAADVSGRALDFAGHAQYSPAGRVAFTAEQGSVRLAEGASLNLSPATKGQQQASNAGVLQVHAEKGEFIWQGDITVLGGLTPVAAQRTGQFQLKADHLDGSFADLNQQLNSAGFTDTVKLDLQNGDLALKDTVTAQHFEVLANGGKVTIDGTINAKDVAVYGRNGIALGKDALINAAATEASQDGGSVLLDTVHRDDTGSGLLDLAQGGIIDVSGVNGGDSGSVHFRTGRDDKANTISVTAINTKILGANPQHTVLEATRVYGGQSVIKTADIKTWQQDTADFMKNAPTLADASGANIVLSPGVEIRSRGDLALNNTWDLLAWRYGEQAIPGFLTLSAGGDLAINASLTDAFATAFLPGQSSMQLQDVLQTGQSWSYQLRAGGDVKLANACLAPSPYGTGERVSTQVKVRTGTGSIGIDAGGDIQFTANSNDATAAAAVYTMGKPASYTRSDLLAGKVPGIPGKESSESDAEYLNRLDPDQLKGLLRYGYFAETLLGLAYMVAEYPTEGGDIRLNAGGNINGINTGQQSSDWLVRSGVLADNNRPTAWGINVSGDRSNPTKGISEQGERFFNQNVGALGGGNVTVNAGGAVQNLSVMLPTTGKAFGTVSEAVNQWTTNGTVVQGGGDLSVTAGGDIVGGEYMVGRGTAQLNAGGSVGRGEGRTPALGTLLALGDGNIQVQARQNVVIASVYNPTIVKQSNPAAGGESQFFTYAPNSEVILTATAGNVVLQNDVDAIRNSKNVDTSASTGFEYAVYPGRLTAAALSGDVRINRSFTLLPSAQGGLAVYAGQNIGTDSDAAQIINVNLSDADPAYLPSVDAPTQQLEGSLSDGLIRARERLDPSTPDPKLIHAATPLHMGDSDKPLFIAKNGDIAFASNSEVTFFLPQASEFIAGRDISNLGLSAQNLSVKDVTRLQAGRDIRYDTLIDGDGIVQANDKQIELGGPGQLQIQAGRNINLGGAAGFNTIGNTKNSALAAGGADMAILAGVAGRLDSAGFITKYFTLESTYLKNLKVLSDDGSDLLASFTTSQKLAYLQNLPDSQKQKLLLDTLFSEIKQAAAAAAAAPENQRKALYQRGFDAIAALFPDKQYQGDLSLVFSQIKTLAGGGINLAVPGGAVNVGLAGRLGGISKGADELGIVAQQTGDVNAFSQGDFNVNQSRVFTMGGGDIAIWSSAGNIDAGKGAKSAISAPAPITTVDAKGNIVTVFPPIVSGSGIQTINPQDKTKKQGNVYLAAPVGIIDAGEAGISGGNVVIAATAVLGASNISASDSSAGVPTAVAPPVVSAGAASAAASAAKQATSANEEEADDRNAADQENKKNNAVLSVLMVDVIGHGECSAADKQAGKAGCDI